MSLPCIDCLIQKFRTLDRHWRRYELSFAGSGVEWIRRNIQRQYTPIYYGEIVHHWKMCIMCDNIITQSWILLLTPPLVLFNKWVSGEKERENGNGIAREYIMRLNWLQGIVYVCVYVYYMCFIIIVNAFIKMNSFALYARNEWIQWTNCICTYSTSRFSLCVFSFIWICTHTHRTFCTSHW